MNIKNILTLSALILLTMSSLNESSIALTVSNKTEDTIKLSIINEGNPHERLVDTVDPGKNKPIQLPEDMIKAIHKHRPLEIRARIPKGAGSIGCHYEAEREDARVSVQFLKDEHGKNLHKLICLPE